MISEPSYAPLGAELRLRPYIAHEDAVWWSGPGEPPPLVLDLVSPDESVESLPFAKPIDAMKAFHRDIVRDLSEEHLKQSTFETLSEADRHAKLPDLARKTRRFLEEALGGEGLQILNAFLDGLPEESVLKASNDGLGRATLLWSVLHPGDLPEDKAAAPIGFLGARFALAQSAYSRSESRRIGAAAIDLLKDREQQRRLGLVDDPGLKSVRENMERDALRGHGGAGFDPLHPLEADGAPADATPTLGSLQELLDYLAFRPRDAVHFACHGMRTAAGYAIRVRLDQEIDSVRLRDALHEKAYEVLQRRAHVSARFLFLNICGSATGTDQWPSPLQSMSYAGPEAVVGTIGNVCDQSAALFAMDFYDRAIAQGDTVGRALLRATRAALEATRNPTNLVFVMAGDPELRIP